MFIRSSVYCIAWVVFVSTRYYLYYTYCHLWYDETASCKSVVDNKPTDTTLYVGAVGVQRFRKCCYRSARSCCFNCIKFMISVALNVFIIQMQYLELSDLESWYDR